MAHEHHHHHNYDWAFALGIVLNTVFIVVEVALGIMAGSLALLADAGHNLSDVLGLFIAWAASRLARRAPTPKRTYGWRKASIMGALINAVILLIALGGIAWEALRRLADPVAASGGVIILVAAVGVVINTATALLFWRGRKDDLNIKGAFLHMAADAGVSLGVVLAGTAIYFTKWFWLDPTISLVIVLIILIGTWRLFRDSFDLAMDAVPAGIDSKEVFDYLAALPGVVQVHDMHIWAMSTAQTALTAHLVKPDPKEDDAVIAQAEKELHERFGIDHITLQWEREMCNSAC